MRLLWFIRLALCAQLFLLGTLLFVASTPNARTSAEELSWTAGTMPNIEVGDEVSVQYPQPGNRDCQSQTLRTLVSPTQNINDLAEKSVQDCTVSNQLGKFGRSYISPNTYYSYKPTIPGNHAPNLVGVPNQAMFLHLHTSGSFTGAQINVFDSIVSNGTFELENSNAYRGYVYKLRSATDNPLKNASGSPIRIKEYAFSSNGEWIVAEVYGTGFVRIHLPSKRMTLFSTEYFLGSSSGVTLAISDDGKYGIKSGPGSGFTRVYDISACQNTSVLTPGQIPGCKERSLRDLLLSKSGGVGSFYLHSMRFAQDGRTVKGLFVVEGPGSVKTKKITLSLDQIVEPPISYLAMGDSFASGEGDMDDGWYEEGTNEGESINLCHLSKRSYSYLLAAGLGIDNFNSVACSGAKTNNVAGDKNNPDNIQYSKSESELGDFFPGYQVQKEYINQSNLPGFITISIGGNDMNFGSILEECILPDTCKYAEILAERNILAKRMLSQYSVLVNTYQNLIEKTKNETKIYVIGYPEFIKSSGGNCALNVQLNDAEREFIGQATRYANDIIEAATKSAGIYYLDAENALENRNLCSEIPDAEMAVNGITVGDDKTIPWYVAAAAGIGSPIGPEGGIILAENIGVGNESFHPNQMGHELYRDRILATVGNPAEFQVCQNPELKICPATSNSVPTPDANYFGSLNQAYNPNDWRPYRFEGELVSLGDFSIQFHLDGLLQRSGVRVELHSDPVQLGSFTADENGELTAELNIPRETPPGFHELHFFGQNVAGEKVDYYQQIYITGPGGDINSNGVPDEDESCGFVPDSGQDYDGDEIDDACDGNIGPEAIVQELDDNSVTDAASSGEVNPPIDDLLEIELTPPAQTPAPEPETQQPEDQPPGQEEEPIDPSPGIITPVNNNPSGSSQSPQTGTSLQPQASQAQNTASGIQTGSRLSQDSNQSSVVILNQGVAQPTLSVVSSPYSSSPAAVASASSAPLDLPTENSGGPSLVLILVGAFLVLAAAGAWNRYVKTPVPTRNKRH